MKLYAIIAAKDEAARIEQVIVETLPFVNTVLVIDDGSSDATKEVSEKAGATVLHHVVNLGKGAAMQTGCDVAFQKGADAVVLLDADGQHEPKEIPKFKKALEKADIVFGIRDKSATMPLILRFGNWCIFKMTQVLFGMSITDTQCGYRALTKKAYEKVKWESSGYSVESEMIAKAKGLKYATVSITTIYADKYKGTTIIDGIKIGLNMIWWKVKQWF